MIDRGLGVAVEERTDGRPPESESAEVLLCCQLWAREGQAAGLTDYEDRVLALIPEHGGQVLQRAVSDGQDGNPQEVHLIAFATKEMLDAYLSDPRRTAFAAERDRVIQRTDLFPVRLR